MIKFVGEHATARAAAGISYIIASWLDWPGEEETGEFAT